MTRHTCYGENTSVICYFIILIDSEYRAVCLFYSDSDNSGSVVIIMSIFGSIIYLVLPITRTAYYCARCLPYISRRKSEFRKECAGFVHAFKYEAEVHHGISLDYHKVCRNRTVVTIINDIKCPCIVTYNRRRFVTYYRKLTVSTVSYGKFKLMLLTGNIHKLIFCYVYVKLTLIYICYRNPGSVFVVIGIAVSENCPCGNTTHIINYKIGVLPTPLSEILTRKSHA